MIKRTITAATLGLALIATPALAGEGKSESKGNTVTVSYRDLNLSTPEGQARLDRRIDVAARQICGYTRASTGTRIKSHAKKACYKKALKSVESQMASMVSEAQRGG